MASESLVKVANFDFGVDFDVERDVSSYKKISNEEIDNFIINQKAKATKYKDTSDLNTFKKFCTTINETREIELIPDTDLDNILCQFFITAKTRKGDLYEPDTLTGIRNSLQRVLFNRGSKINIREDNNFIKSRQVLASRRKQLTKLGKGNKPHATRPLTDDEIDHLYSCGYFGSDNALSLQRTVWWHITKHFGHRARDESRQMKFGDIVLETEFNTDKTYIMWITERSTKTRNGERPMGHSRVFNPKAYATETDRCPVKTFQKFVSHRPKSMCKAESPFFLAARLNVDLSLISQVSQYQL